MERRKAGGALRRKGPATRTEISAALRWGPLGDGRRKAGWGGTQVGFAEEQRGRSAKQRDSHNSTDPRPRPRERLLPGQGPRCCATGPP